MKVVKRNGAIVNFDESRIINAIEKAMMETKIGVDQEISKTIANKISKQKFDVIKVEQIQDMVEELLMDTNRKDVAKSYILYRNSRDKTRHIVKTTGLLTDEFLSKYKHQLSPMNQLGSFVYYRTYSRWLPEEQRREYWWETVKRAVEYNCGLVPTSKEEAEKLYDNIFNLRQFLSGRTFWVGGTEVSKKYSMSNFNCSFVVVDDFEIYKDLFYLLMIGSGVGIRILEEDIEKLPKIKTDNKITHQDYIPVSKNKRQDNTSLIFFDNNVEIVVGDSKEGWSQALDFFLKILWHRDYTDINHTIINYNNVRPKGERLKTFGGTASGHESIKAMFYKIDKVIKSAGARENSNYIKIRPIDCMDIANIIGENVVCGGVRRTSEIVLFDETDKDVTQSKNNLYIQLNGKWEENLEISHRKMSNNSIFYQKKPIREQLHWQIEQMRHSGEPAFVNAEAANKRRPNFKGGNPCMEILLDSRGMCNLTTVNVASFVKNDKTLDCEGLYEAQKLSAKAGYRMSLVDFELHKWDIINKRDRLIGCSLTGWQDMIDAVGLTNEQEVNLLKKLKQIANDESNKLADELGKNQPVLSCTLKPEGTLSLLPGVSPGLHYSHSPYYIRRIRINSNDPLVKVCEELEYPVFVEIGQDEESCNTKVIEFPVKTLAKKTKFDISAIQQLENYKKFMKNYVEHNASITVTVKNSEWNDVEEWLWNNWDDVVAISFLSLDDTFYQLMPYETITEEEYNKRISKMKPFIPSLLLKYEKEEIELDIGNESCESGACPIR